MVCRCISAMNVKNCTNACGPTLHLGSRHAVGNQTIARLITHHGHGTNHVHFVRRTILATYMKHIQHLLSQHQQDIHVNLYRDALELVEDLLDLIL